MAAAAAQLLGEDGRGYELARRLEACGAWRAWLGDDAAHAALAQHLSTPSTWDAFLSPAPGASPPSRPFLLLQLRARALLFDKASAALLLSRGAAPAGLHSIDVNFLQLHGDDIYFSLEDEQDDNTQYQMHSRTAFSPRREGSVLSQRHNRYGEIPDTWYKQYAEKFRTTCSKRCSGDKEIPMRTPEGMSDYLKDVVRSATGGDGEVLDAQLGVQDCAWADQVQEFVSSAQDFTLGARDLPGGTQQLAFGSLPVPATDGQDRSAYGMRMPPVKVEAFHELVSGDSSLKHDNDPNKLTSPK
ncbi:hypothetical protein PR202_gb10596 [Eleusine coracana subsp. coracana]|uniref:Uncharacterized protein n=1 Tax=Eleusine coracana subsp. coracana TaxID=191504 RepID=A0AAV5EK95_ELECO|nr:hypothetical protein PR202_gb10596 [Eleusine coracana subsp. coracana]